MPAQLLDGNALARQIRGELTVEVADFIENNGVVPALAAILVGGDPGAIVLDEIVVLPIVFLAGPPMSWTVLFTGYVLFRICDIWKPGLVRVAERLPGGLGIVADDAVAAVLANLLLQILVWIDRAGGYEWLVLTATM